MGSGSLIRLTGCTEHDDVSEHYYERGQRHPYGKKTAGFSKQGWNRHTAFTFQCKVKFVKPQMTRLTPLEGSLLILPGSGMVALGIYLGGKDRRTVLYWTWAFILIAVGVGALFGLSAVGGIGGKGGHSMWWGILILPYPAGWLMALAGGVAGLVRLFKTRGQAARA